MSEIAYCKKCDRIKDVDEDCNYLDCNPELDQREVSADELYMELRKLHVRLAVAEERADRLADALDAIEGIAHPPGCTEQGIHDIWTITRAALAAREPSGQHAPRQAAERGHFHAIAEEIARRQATPPVPPAS